MTFPGKCVNGNVYISIRLFCQDKNAKICNPSIIGATGRSDRNTSKVPPPYIFRVGILQFWRYSSGRSTTPNFFTTPEGLIVEEHFI